MDLKQIVESNLRQMVESSAQEFCEKTYINFYDRLISFKKFDSITNNIGVALNNLGVKKAQTVAFMINNSPEFMFTYFGIIKIGAVAIPINCLWREDQVEYLLNHSEAKCVIFDGQYSGLMNKIRGNIPTVNHFIKINEQKENKQNLNFDELSKDKEDKLYPVVMRPSDLFTIMYTSGTTGKPKGVMWTHKNILTNIQYQISAFNYSQKDTFICNIPLFHANALILTMLTSLASGATVILRKSFSAKEFWPLIEQFKITTFSTVPAVYKILLEIAEKAEFGTVDTSSLRFAGCASAPMPAESIRKFEEKFKIPIIEGYGLTEAISPLKNPREKRKIGSIGKPTPPFEVKLVDDDGNEVPMGEAGEIILRGPVVSPGYYKNPEATDAAFKNGWFYTKDLATRDEDNYFYFKGRKDDVIIRGAEKIDPTFIESCILKHPKVSEAVAFGIPDPILGEDIKVAIVLQEGQQASEQEILDYCKNNLSKNLIPKSVQFLTELPKTAVGKIRRNVLKHQ